MKKIVFVFVLLLIISCNKDIEFDVSHLTTEITTGNSWVINDVHKSSEVITEKGITNWKDSNDTIRTFFYTEKEATIPFGILAKGKVKMSISYNDKTKNIDLANSEYDTIYIDDYVSSGKGYNYIDFHSVTNTNIEIKSILMKQPEDSTTLKYLKDDYYFGRRGPSTHLVFETPTNDIEWMYSEIEIDKEEI